MGKNSIGDAGDWVAKGKWYPGEKQMRENPTMTLPITAVQTAVVSVCALTWMVGAGLQSGHLTDGTLFANLWSFKVAGALLWTGVITTALTRLGEQGEALHRAEVVADSNQYVIDKSRRVVANMTWSGWLRNKFTALPKPAAP